MGLISKIKEKITAKLIGKFLASLIRKILAALSGYLIVKLGLDAELVHNFQQATMELIIALLPILLSVIWGWVEKVKK